MSSKLPYSREPGAPGSERRRALRKPACGAGWMEPCDGSAAPQKVRLLDESPNGFRVRHHCAALCAGQRVRFHYGQADRLALVIWNRVLGPDVESGLLIVKEPE